MISPASELAQSLNCEVRQYRTKSVQHISTPKPGEACYRKMKARERQVLSFILDENERIYREVD